MRLINSDKDFCYRITHIQNLPKILEAGILCCKNHPQADPDFISIGNPEIINVRDTTAVKIEDYGNIGDYLPFYFTPRSMMLYNIVTGCKEPVVPKVDRQDILVIRCLINQLAKSKKFFFTDGQANATALTGHYNDLQHLNKIDWEIIQKSNFNKSDGKIDRSRRYQAEFLVHNQVPIEFIESFNVYNNKARIFVSNELNRLEIPIPIQIQEDYFF